MRWNTDGWRVWLFRGLVASAACLMVASAIMPWWTAHIVPGLIGSAPEFDISIYQYGIPSITDISSLELGYLARDITPLYQIILAWVYIAVSVGLILLSTWLKGNKGRWLLGGIGLSYIAYAVIAVFVVIAGRLGDFGLSLQGYSEGLTPDADLIEASASLQVGYYLAHGAGWMCIALALLRNIIIGKPRIDG